MAMSNRQKKIAQIVTIYIGMTLLLTLLGVMIGHSQRKADGKSKATHFGTLGFLLGVILSVILYFTVGKKEIEKASSTGSPSTAKRSLY